MAATRVLGASLVCLIDLKMEPPRCCSSINSTHPNNSQAALDSTGRPTSSRLVIDHD